MAYRQIRWYSLHVGTSTKRNYYDVLGITNAATEIEIKNAYFTKVKLLHPDANAEEEDKKASAEFLELKSAYDVLRNIDKRRLYDANLLIGKGHEDIHDSFHSNVNNPRYNEMREEAKRWRQHYYGGYGYYGAGRQGPYEFRGFNSAYEQAKEDFENSKRGSGEDNLRWFGKWLLIGYCFVVVIYINGYTVYRRYKERKFHQEIENSQTEITMAFLRTAKPGKVIDPQEFEEINQALVTDINDAERLRTETLDIRYPTFVQRSHGFIGSGLIERKAMEARAHQESKNIKKQKYHPLAYGMKLSDVKDETLPKKFRVNDSFEFDLHHHLTLAANIMKYHRQQVVVNRKRAFERPKG